MDFTVLRSVTTLISFITFVGIIVWAYRSANKAAFDEAERLPFLDDELGLSSRSGSSVHAAGVSHE